MVSDDDVLRVADAAYSSYLHRYAPPWVEGDDFLQLAREAAVRCRDRFDPSRGYAFFTFAWPYVVGAMRDETRRMTGIRSNREWRRPEIVELYDTHHDPRSEADRVNDQIDARIALRRVLTRLAAMPELDREIFLSSLEHDGQRQAAVRHNLSRSAVCHRVKKTRAKLAA